MTKSEKKLKDANLLMNRLGKRNKKFMGLTVREEGIFDTLLWLIGDSDESPMY